MNCGTCMGFGNFNKGLVYLNIIINNVKYWGVGGTHFLQIALACSLTSRHLGKLYTDTKTVGSSWHRMRAVVALSQSIAIVFNTQSNAVS